MRSFVVKAVELRRGYVRILDQTKLPNRTSYVICRSASEVARALKEMRVRGAPMIGLVGAMALAVEAHRNRHMSRNRLLERLRKCAQLLRNSRPTGNDLYVTTQRILKVAEEADDISSRVFEEVEKMEREMREVSNRLGEIGASLIESGQTILTHCNTGSLAMPGDGTALSAVKHAWRQGKRIKVVVTETRPLLQGLRLTAWELEREGIPCTVIVDSAAGYCMQRGMIDLVMVGADRVLKDLSVINKIGTYQLAVLAARHKIPFYVFAPTTTFSDSLVEIEERGGREILDGFRLRVGTYNPAFDVTPRELITGIVTENGIIRGKS